MTKKKSKYSLIEDFGLEVHTTKVFGDVCKAEEVEKLLHNLAEQLAEVGVEFEEEITGEIH